jgi:hypothetical protein
MWAPTIGEPSREAVGYPQMEIAFEIGEQRKGRPFWAAYNLINNGIK